MLLPNDDGTYTAGPLDVLCVMHDVVKTQRFHPLFLEEHPFPGPIQEPSQMTIARLMSKFHHTAGFETLEEALAYLKDPLKMKVRCENVWEVPGLWDGEPMVLIVPVENGEPVMPAVKTAEQINAEADAEAAVQEKRSKEVDDALSWPEEEAVTTYGMPQPMVQQIVEGTVGRKEERESNNFFKGDVEACTDIEALKTSMRMAVEVRDRMGGDLWHNILNDEATRYANRLAALGVPHDELMAISGGGMRRR